MSAIIEVGRQLVVAKQDCGHGGWGELTGRTTGKPLLPFSRHTAQRFIAISENTALSNGAHARHLPASWYTLSVLASLDPDDIEAAIADGAIPRLGRRSAVLDLPIVLHVTTIVVEVFTGPSRSQQFRSSDPPGS